MIIVLHYLYCYMSLYSSKSYLIHRNFRKEERENERKFSNFEPNCPSVAHYKLYVKLNSLNSNNTHSPGNSGTITWKISTNLLFELSLYVENRCHQKTNLITISARLTKTLIAFLRNPFIYYGCPQAILHCIDYVLCILSCWIYHIVYVLTIFLKVKLS